MSEKEIEIKGEEKSEDLKNTENIKSEKEEKKKEESKEIKSDSKDKEKDENKKKKSTDTRSIKKLEKEIEKLKDSSFELKDSLHRTLAEFDNYKKRTQKEKEALYKEAVADIMGKFLPIIDSIDSAIKSCTTDDDGNVTDGLVLVHKKISEVLTSMDIEEIPAEAEEFDPNLHHAIMHMEDETYEENIVVEVFQKGYKCKDKIIRPSMVKVAN